MLTSRRTFFRVLGAAAIGTAVSQIPTPEPSWWASQHRSHGGALTYEILEKAVQRYQMGASGPGYIVTSRAVAETYTILGRQTGLIFDVEF